jgi:hypothetical protein
MAEAVGNLTLVFDSLYQPSLATMHAFDGPTRQRLYRKGNLFIGISTESPSDSPGLSLSGQVLDSGRGMARSDVSIKLQSGTDTLAETSTNEFGKFCLKFSIVKELRLVLSLQEEGTIVVPLSELACARPA